MALFGLLAFVLTFGLGRLTSGGVAIPTAIPSAAVATLPITPTAAATEVIGSRIGLRGDLTPGALNPAATQAALATTVCKPGWASSVRPPAAYTAALKLVQIVEYGYADRNPSDYQEDHLVPLELGGAPRDKRNCLAGAEHRHARRRHDGRQQAEGRARGRHARRGVPGRGRACRRPAIDRE